MKTSVRLVHSSRHLTLGFHRLWLKMSRELARGLPYVLLR